MSEDKRIDLAIQLSESAARVFAAGKNHSSQELMELSKKLVDEAKRQLAIVNF
jgi:hypothetical protein